MENRKRPLKIALRAGISAIIIFLIFWFTLPPINLRSGEFWSFVVASVAICLAVNALSGVLDFFKNLRFRPRSKDPFPAVNTEKSRSGRLVKIFIIAVGVIIFLSIVASVIGSQFFNASRYNQLLTLSDGDFTADVAELSMSQIPVVDRDTAQRLGQRKLGEMSDLVSQFVIEDDYTQINYQGRPVRVTPLAYGDVIKWKMCIRDSDTEAHDPVQRGSDTKVHQVFHDDVTGVFGSCKSGFDHGKSGLHKEHQRRAEQYPGSVYTRHQFHNVVHFYFSSLKIPFISR